MNTSFPAQPDKKYSPREEAANAATHGFGLAAGIVGLYFLLDAAADSGDVWRITGNAVFGVSLIVLYSTSTLYHLSRNPEKKRSVPALRPRRHIPAHRRYLQPVFAGQHPRRLGLVVIWYRMGDCPGRYHFQDLLPCPLSETVARPLPRHGMALRGGLPQVLRRHFNRQPAPARRWRAVLYLRRVFLPQGADAIPPCRLASFRTGRKCISLFCCLVQCLIRQ
jgi:hypothetical protein